MLSYVEAAGCWDRGECDEDDSGRKGDGDEVKVVLYVFQGRDKRGLLVGMSVTAV